MARRIYVAKAIKEKLSVQDMTYKELCAALPCFTKRQISQALNQQQEMMDGIRSDGKRKHSVYRLTRIAAAKSSNHVERVMFL